MYCIYSILIFIYHYNLSNKIEISIYNSLISLIWCCGLLLANWFIVGAGPVCFALLPIILSRSIFNPEPAHVDPICVDVLFDIWFLELVDVGVRRFVTDDNPIVPKYKI